MTDREAILEIISDLTKSATGMRIRKDFAAMGDEELQNEFDYWAKASEEACEQDRRHEARCKVEWEARLADIIKAGAGDRVTAIRWDMQAMGCDARDVDGYCYHCGLSYEMVLGLEAQLDARSWRTA
jgi:hypothetical protein